MESIQVIGNKCVGCRSCEQVCPKLCIQIKANKEGFLYPDVDENLCVRCGICAKHCPAAIGMQRAGEGCGNIGMQDRYADERKPLKAFGLKNKNQEQLFHSASGGASDVLARAVVNEGGSVFGCAWSPELKAEHVEIIREDELWKIQSSKYVQSDTGNTYSLVKERLNEGKKVLFTGTPCQVAGLYAFLGGKNYDNLYTIDLICHGVPSPKLLEKYFAYLEDVMGEKIETYNFRSKEKRGWGTQYRYRAETENKKRTGLSVFDKYGAHFKKGYCYRECCYQCDYANLSRRGDITVGDFWGIDSVNSKFSSPMGVSSLLINTEKGLELMSKIKNRAEIVEVSVESVCLKQGNLREPAGRPDDRDTFYEQIDEADFVKNLKVGLQMKERIKAIIPRAVTVGLKRILTHR